MSRKAIIFCLAALNLWALAGVILVPLGLNLGDGPGILRLLRDTHLLVWPWGPPLLLMVLVAMLGSRDARKLLARMGAALAFYVALYWVMIGYAFAGRFAIADSDWPIFLGSVALALILGWLGFRPDRQAA